MYCGCMPLLGVMAFFPSRVAAWVWIGHCPLCRTSVLVDDEFVRVDGEVLHAECDEYRRGRGRAIS